MIQEEYKVYLENTNKAVKELKKLYHNDVLVAKKISEIETEIEGYTNLKNSEIIDALNIIQSRYGYYCTISYRLGLDYMRLKIKVKIRGMEG